jgi:hypothetical protein
MPSSFCYIARKLIKSAPVVAVLITVLHLGASEAPRIASYQMDVGLHPDTKEIRGREILTWINPTGDPTGELWFHLYQNAFRNEKSTYLEERENKHQAAALEGNWGWIEIDSIRIVGGLDITASMEYLQPDDGNEEDRTVARFLLPHPVAPGDSVRLQIDFRTKLPWLLDRSGFWRDFYMIAQWFPKIGVFEGAERGWNCHQFHANSEFFSDFGTYDVRITLPNRFVIGATGDLLEETGTTDGTKTYHFYQEDIHDFAWTASPDYILVERDFIAAEEISQSECDSLSGIFNIPPDEVRINDIRMILLIQPAHAAQTERHLEALSNAIKYFGLWYGRYPYSTITLYDPPDAATSAGGMEYPTLIGGRTSWLNPAGNLDLEDTIIHEFGHQYWYGLIASNEFEEPWLDEGLTTYTTEKVRDSVYGSDCYYKSFGGDRGLLYPGLDWLRLDTYTGTFGLITFPLIGTYLEDVPIAPFESRKRQYLQGPKLDKLRKNSWSFSSERSYDIYSYYYPAITLKTIENILGEEAMARVMREYFQRFIYSHPTTEDFLEVITEVSGIDINDFLRQALEGSYVFDYSVDMIESDDVSIVTGEQDTTRERKVEEDPSSVESRVRLRRLGEFIHPVDLLVTFEDGEVVTECWSGRERWTEYNYRRSSGIKSAEIDPLHQILIDIDTSNNSQTMDVDRRPALRWSSRWLMWIQNLLHLASIFG